jgi:hypothetical protein
MTSRYSFAEMTNRVRMMDTATLQERYDHAVRLIGMYPEPTDLDFPDMSEHEEAMAERVADFLVQAENELGRRWIAPFAAAFRQDAGRYAE